MYFPLDLNLNEYCQFTQQTLSDLNVHGRSEGIFLILVS